LQLTEVVPVKKLWTCMEPEIVVSFTRTYHWNLSSASYMHIIARPFILSTSFIYQLVHNRVALKEY